MREVLLYLVVMLSSLTLLRGLTARSRAATTRFAFISAASSSSAAADYTIPPELPVNFGIGFKPHSYSQPLPLERLNPHPHDKDISFDEPNHVYFYKGGKIDVSVTGVVENYFSKFDKHAALNSMKNGRKWPRPEYMNKQGVPFTDAQIFSMWDSTGLFARNQGTWMHLQIERYLNALNITEGAEGRAPELAQFFEFYDRVLAKNEILPYRTEWRICAPQQGIAGSVDFVGKAKDGSFVLVDWKRSKKLPESVGNSYGRRGLHPISHIEDTEASKYFLQLNIYRYILQEVYGLKISRVILASFHPHFSSFFSLDVPVWDAEVALVLKDVEAKRINSIGDSTSFDFGLAPPASKNTGAPVTRRISNPLKDSSFG